MVFSTYVINYNDYKTGKTIGTLVDFPCSKTKYDNILANINVGVGEKYLIIDCKYPIYDYQFDKGELYEDLNNIAEKLNVLNDEEMKIVNAYLYGLNAINSIKTIENVIEYLNIDTLEEYFNI